MGRIKLINNKLSGQGFTLIEVLVVIAIISIIAAISISDLHSVSEGINLKDANGLVETQIKLARTNSLSALSDTNYGIRFESDKITLFNAGTSTDVTAYDLPSGVQIYNISLAGGGADPLCNNGSLDAGETGVDCGGICIPCSSIVFNRLTGTSNSGTFGIRLSGNPSKAEQININNQGQVSKGSFLASTEPVVLEGTDNLGYGINARHIHFNIPLTWSINSGTTSILRLRAADGTTKDIDTGPYFNSGIFDWQGTVTLNGESHKLRVHTIGGGNLLCIIRDRTENNKTLTVSFINSGTEKQIVTYTENGGTVTITPGSGVLSPIEPQ